MLVWINFVIGVGLAFVVGDRLLGFSPGGVLNCIGASEVAAFLALVLTLRAEAVSWIRQRVLTRSLKTWTVFSGIYFGLLLALAPPVRGWIPLAAMFIPLALANGPAIVAFGPVQDFFVRRAQRRNQVLAQKTS